MDITITIIDAEAMRRVEALDLNDLAQAIAIAVGADGALPRAKYYPPQRRAKQPFVSAKQRRFFFAALRDGRITVPYQRTYKLASNWRIQAAPPFSATLNNDTSYAPLVIGLPEQQTNYHKSWWLAADRIAAETEANDAQRIGERAAQLAILRAALNP